MRKWLILLSTLSVTGATAAPAWTWVDSSGQRHYSDRPVPGAKQVELAGAQTFDAPARPAAPAASDSKTPQRQTPAAKEAYTLFNIVSPTQQQTLWNIGATLPVQVALEPGLQTGDHLDVFLDGQRKDLSETTTQFSVPDVFRGIHTIQAVIIDSSGMEVLRSLATTFMVQQTSVQNPNSLPGRTRQQAGN